MLEEGFEFRGTVREMWVGYLERSGKFHSKDGWKVRGWARGSGKESQSWRMNENTWLR